MMIRQPVIRWLPASTLNRRGTKEVALIANRLMPIPTLGDCPCMRTLGSTVHFDEDYFYSS